MERMITKSFKENAKKAIALALALTTTLSAAAVPVDVNAASSGTVSAASVKEIPITKIDFPEKVTVNKDETKTLEATILPDDTTYKINVSWQHTGQIFSLKTIGSGSYWGKPTAAKITGKKAGTDTLCVDAKVYDSSNNYVKTIKVTSKITVKDVAASGQQGTDNNTGSGSRPNGNMDGTNSSEEPQNNTSGNDTQPVNKDATYLNLNKTELVTDIGKAVTLKANTDGYPLTWTSSNSNVATVKNGVVEAKKAGIATITVKSGNKTQKCKVTVRYRSQLLIDCHRSGQTITIKGTGHAYHDATGYEYTLIAKSKTGTKLKTVKKTSGEVKFTDLNVGEQYYVLVREYKNGKTYTDTQKYAVRTPSKADCKRYTSRAKLSTAIENAAFKRSKSITVYYPKEQWDISKIIFDKPILAIPYSRLADVYVDECSCKNKYNETIRINGKKYYKYIIKFSGYRYSKSQQKKYVNKVKSLAKSLHGTDSDKVKQFNKFIKTTKYDHAGVKQYNAGTYKESPTDMFTAYSVLVKKKGVCEGEAVAAAIVLTRAGVKCEYVWGKNLRTGNSHAWNIVKCGKKWYWCDFCYSIFGYNEILMGSKAFNKTHKLNKSECKEQMSRVGTIVK